MIRSVLMHYKVAPVKDRVQQGLGCLTSKKTKIIQLVDIMHNVDLSFLSTNHMLTLALHQTPKCLYYAGFRLTCRLLHCCFDDDISSTAQASLAAEGWPSGKQRQANRSITLPLCPPRQIADSWILFNSGAIAAGWKAKAALPLRAATLKQQAMITRYSGKAASGKLVWNQHYSVLDHTWATLC